MAHKTRAVFLEDSDGDDVATDSTAESAQEEFYGVEDILAEERDAQSGQPFYLLKWMGYDLMRATWEPLENIQDDALIRDWEQKKELIAAGRVQPFDVRKWEDDVIALNDARAARHRRRRKKRRKRGLLISPSTSDGEDGDGDADLSPKHLDAPGQRKRAPDHDDDTANVRRASPTKQGEETGLNRRSGQSPVTSSRRGSGDDKAAGSSGESAEVIDNSAGGDASDVNSLFDEGSQPVYPDLIQSPHIAPHVGSLPAKPVAGSPEKAPRSTPNLTAAVTTSKGHAASATKDTASVVAKPGDPAPTARRTTSIFVHWSDPAEKRKKRVKKRARIAGEKPNGSQAEKFANLSTQQRFQKNSKNEPAPDPSALTMVDPKTGRPQPGQKSDTLMTDTSVSTTKPGPARIDPDDEHPVYGRRTPPRVDRRRSITPPSPKPAPATILHTAANGPASAQPRGTAQPKRKLAQTCRYWLDGNCKYTAETCRFMHHIDPSRDTGQVSPQRRALSPPQAPSSKPFADERIPRHRITCYFWQQGHCKKPANECQFAHYDTGIYASEPGSLSSRASVSSSVKPKLPLRKSSRHAGSAEDQSSPVIKSFVMHDDLPPPGSASAPKDRSLPSQVSQSEIATPGRDSDADEGSLPGKVQFVTKTNNISHPLEVTLHVAGLKKFKPLFEPVEDGVSLIPDSMVAASDLQSFCASFTKEAANWPTGSIEPHVESVTAADEVAEWCKLHASGMAYFQDRYILLIYPSNTEEWQFIDGSDTRVVPMAPLRFRVFPPPHGFNRPMAQSIPHSAVPTGQPVSTFVGRRILGLDANVLLYEKEGHASGHKVFLVWPPSRQGELQAIVKYFQDLKCRVYHSGVPGAWDFFRRHYGRACLIMIHGETPLWEIPRLANFIASTGGGVRLFRIESPDPPHRAEENDRAAAYTCVRLFPHGKVTFITDDLFVYHPEKANDIICQFIEMNENKPVGGENDKIAARPGVKDWLYKLAIEKSNERGRRDPRWMSLYESICTLCPPEAEDPYDPPNPLPSSNLVSAPVEELPSFMGMWDQDETKATDMMVEWFAGWSLLNLDKFRAFRVCYEAEEGQLVVDANGRSLYQTTVDPRGWTKKYQHISVVTPGQLLRKKR